MERKTDLTRKINTYAMIGSVGVSVFLIERILDASWYLVTVLSCALVMMVAARVLIQLSDRDRLASHLVTMGAFIALAGAQLKDGAKDSPSMWLVSIVPLIAGDLLGPKQIPGYFVLSAFSISAPWISDFFGWSYPEPILVDSARLVFLRIIGILTVTAVCVHVAREYDDFVVELAQKRREVFKTHQQAEALNQQKASFLRQMSREIRAPLNGIKGMTQVWVRQDLDEATAESVGTMDRCANNLLNIINEAQDLSQVEQHKFDIHLHPFSVQRLVGDVVTLFQGKAKEKHIELSSFGPKEECFGFGDEKRLTQVLSNLIGNAVKFSDQGLVELRWRWNKENIEFEISDEGIGMSKSQVDSLFTEFSQVHEEESLRRGGSGLGLTISKHFVEAMGGTLKVESEEGHGSCFRVELPMKRSSAQQYEAQSQKERTAPRLDLRVLVLDDDLASLWVQRLALESMGCRVDCSKTTAAAVELTKLHAFDLLLIDLRMPETNGIEALKLLRQHAKNSPAIALTASAEPEDKEACLDAGFAQVLLKPFEYQELQRAISQECTAASSHKQALEKAS